MKFLWFKFKLGFHVFIELFLLGAMVVLIANIFQSMIIEICQRIRNDRISLSITLIAKICSLKTEELLRNSITTDLSFFICTIS